MRARPSVVAILRAAALSVAALLILLTSPATEPRALQAADYLLTIGGGYNPQGNQASLEANVIFFQTIVREQHRGQPTHEVFFADGTDSTADLQVLSRTAQKLPPATEVLAALHRRGGTPVEYRNHKVPAIAGGNSPELIHAGLSRIAKAARSGDRLIVYVTAHGSAGKEKTPYNTTIDCWNGKAITVREFTTWLGEVSPDVPVVMVMAQCYCGGFSHTIFEDEATNRLSRQVRIGFFAQQHNLPAAGCRPDIDNDDEFSSYFWGAIAGRRRTGEPVTGCDLDGDGRVSFAEAYAYAVVASNTIDIPLRSSEALLRTFSRMSQDGPLEPRAEASDGPVPMPPPEKEPEKDSTEKEVEPKPETADTPSADVRPAPVAQRSSPLSAIAETLGSMVADQGPVMRRIVEELSSQLGLSPQDEVKTVVSRFDEQRRQMRAGFGRGPRGRRGGGRRELLQEITEKWPDLGDAQKWERSPLLKAENQELLLADLRSLPSFELFDQRRRERNEQSDRAEVNELREIKFRRLMSALEVILLERNLPRTASAEVAARYREMLALEESTLAPPERGRR